MQTKILAPLVLAATCAVLPLRADDPKIAGPNSYIRFLHAVSGGAKVDVFVDGNKKLNDIEFDSVSKYLRFPAGYHSFRVVSNNPSRTLLSGTRTTKNGGFYTVAAYGSGRSVRGNVYEDSAGSVAYGQSRLTFHHLSPANTRIDVVGYTLNGRRIVLARNLKYRSTLAVTTPALPMTVQFRANNRVLKTVTGVSPRAGRKYAAYIIGRERVNFQVLLAPSASQ